MPILLDYLGVSRNTMSLHNKSITGQDHFPQKNPNISNDFRNHDIILLILRFSASFWQV